MAVKTLDNHIKKAFVDLGFTETEIRDGCWLLERENKETGEKIKVAWIALHKFLERAAIMAGITFDEPKIFSLQPNEIALFVNGHHKELSAWAIGEASDANLTKMSKAYRWAMAEKRAKDRVILKLLGIAGDMYSEEEADEFKEKKPERTEFEKEASKEKAQHTRMMNKAVAAQDESLVKPVESKLSIDDRFKNAQVFLSQYTPATILNAKPSAFDSIRKLIVDLNEVERYEDADLIEARFNALVGVQDNIPY